MDIEQATEALELCCMIDFYKSQTDEEEVTPEEVEEYFAKLTDNALDEDVLVWHTFRETYMEAIAQGGG